MMYKVIETRTYVVEAESPAKAEVLVAQGDVEVSTYQVSAIPATPPPTKHFDVV